jgi:hypothetical protein
MPRKQKKEKIIHYLSESERRAIINDAVLKGLSLNITFTSQMWSIFKEYITNGTEQNHEIQIEDLNRIMVIQLRNIKGKRSYINLRESNKKIEDMDQVEQINMSEFNTKVNQLKRQGVL